MRVAFVVCAVAVLSTTTWVLHDNEAGLVVPGLILVVGLVGLGYLGHPLLAAVVACVTTAGPVIAAYLAEDTVDRRTENCDPSCGLPLWSVLALVTALAVVFVLVGAALRLRLGPRRSGTLGTTQT